MAFPTPEPAQHTPLSLTHGTEWVLFVGLDQGIQDDTSLDGRPYLTQTLMELCSCGMEEKIELS